MTTDPARLRADIETLATFGATAEGGVGRPSFSTADRDARRWLAGRCREAGLTPREDAAGNLFARWEPPGTAGAPAVWVGSHLDSVPNGGPLDGALGVVTGLEVLRTLVAEGAALRRPVELVAFADEEGAYLGFLGSRAAIEGLTPADLAPHRGRDGDRLVDAMAAAGYPPERIAEAQVDPADVHAYVELHIEQGAVLEGLGARIGVVTDIVGVGRAAVMFTGRADHAGTTPMDLRRDALRGAAGLLTELTALPAALGAPAAVITCGRVSVAPGADNIVPAEVTLHLDIRDRSRAAIEALEAEVERRAQAAAAVHGLTASLTRVSLTDPVPLDPDIQTRTRTAAMAAGLPTHTLVSGAGHDAQVVATAVRTGMIFVPSIAGRSHSPAERTSWEDIGAGAEVLHAVVTGLAS